jgi:ligand-binding sensor domain-containing protein
MRRLIVLLALLVILSAPQAFPQILPFQTYSVKDGLVSNDILTLFQDSQGYLWIGTMKGISVYDGWTFVNYTLADGLPPGGIRQILEERTQGPKVIWILTVDGAVCKITSGKIVPVLFDSSLTWARRVTSLCQDHEGTLWAGTEDTVAQIIADQLKPVVTGVRMKDAAIVEQGKSLLWFACQSGLFQYSFDTRRFMKIEFGSDSSYTVGPLCPDDKGNLWVRLNTPYPYVKQRTLLANVRGGEVVSRSQMPGFFPMAHDHNGHLWLAEDNGLHKIIPGNMSPGSDTPFTVENGLPETDIKTLLVDRESNLWIGGQKKGLVKLADQSSISFPLAMVPSPLHSSVGAADTNGHLWVISSMGLWEFWQEGGSRWHQALTVPPEVGTEPEYPVFDFKRAKVRRPCSVFCDRQGRLWVGFTDEHICCFGVHPQRHGPSLLTPIRLLQPEIDFPRGYPLCFIIDRAGLVWYSANNSLLLLNPANAHPLVRILPLHYVRALCEDSSGGIWAGTYQEGIFRLDPDSIETGSFRVVHPSRQRAEQRIASIFQCHDGTLLISDEKSGLAIVSADTSIRRSIPEGLPSSIVRSAVQDKNGRLWVSTSEGVAYLDSVSAPFIHPVGELAGLSVACSGSTRSGYLWFVTLEGLTLYDPGALERGSSVPEVVFTGLKVNDKEARITGSIELPHDSNTIEVSYAAITFLNQQEITYQYRLLGHIRSGAARQKAGLSRSPNCLLVTTR